MRIGSNVELLPVAVNRPQVNMVLNMVLTWDEHNLVLIDTGLPGQVQDIAKAIADAGFDAKSLTHIIITHQDLDHIGCALDLQKIAPNVKILAHYEEAPYIDGRKVPVKLADMLEKYDNLSLEHKEQVNQSKKSYDERRIKIDQELKDKELLPICGDIEVVHTPGHTPGHISLYLHESHIMVCGDAANIDDGRVVSSNPVYTLDMELAERSFEKIKGYTMVGIVAYHGGYLAVND